MHISYQFLKVISPGVQLVWSFFFPPATTKNVFQGRDFVCNTCFYCPEKLVDILLLLDVISHPEGCLTMWQSPVRISGAFFIFTEVVWNPCLEWQFFYYMQISRIWAMSNYVWRVEDNKIRSSRWWWLMLLAPEFGRQRLLDLWVWGQHGLQNELQDDQGYTEKPYFKKSEKQHFLSVYHFCSVTFSSSLWLSSRPPILHLPPQPPYCWNYKNEPAHQTSSLLNRYHSPFVCCNNTSLHFCQNLTPEHYWKGKKHFIVSKMDLWC